MVVLSHGYWQRRFGGKPAVVGAVLAINGTPYTVVGVGPPRFTGTRMERTTDFWVPATMQAPAVARLGLAGRATIAAGCW